MFESRIVISKDSDELEKLFLVEDKNLGRSSYAVKKSKGKLILDIKANDATALKTVMNTISKVLIIWEKSKV